MVSPNPMVGSVVVSDGAIVGEGFHEGPGLPHAEIMALNHAGERARGATLYTSLEPCDHYGRTPPCTEAIVRAGIARVVSATRDPNPVVDGQGIRTLRAARRRGARGDPRRRSGSAERGVRQARADRDALRDLEGGRLARRQGRGARRLVPVDHRRGRAGRRPSAPSLGGRDRGGGGHGARRRSRAHRPRSPTTGGGRRSASWWTRRGRVGPSGDLFDDQAPTLVATTELAPPAARDAWRDAGAEVLVVEHDDVGVGLTALMADLGKRDVQGVLLEGGPTLAWSAVRGAPRRHDRPVPGAEADRRARRPRPCWRGVGSRRSGTRCRCGSARWNGSART